jgi:hypothetical protein
VKGATLRCAIGAIHWLPRGVKGSESDLIKLLHACRLKTRLEEIVTAERARAYQATIR